jgi:hypothetical protein
MTETKMENGVNMDLAETKMEDNVKQKTKNENVCAFFAKRFVDFKKQKEYELDMTSKQIVKRIPKFVLNALKESIEKILKPENNDYRLEYDRCVCVQTYPEYYKLGLKCGNAGTDDKVSIFIEYQDQHRGLFTSVQVSGYCDIHINEYVIKYKQNERFEWIKVSEVKKTKI